MQIANLLEFREKCSDYIWHVLIYIMCFGKEKMCLQSGKNNNDNKIINNVGIRKIVCYFIQRMRASKFETLNLGTEGTGK